MDRAVRQGGRLPSEWTEQRGGSAGRGGCGWAGRRTRFDDESQLDSLGGLDRARQVGLEMATSTTFFTEALNEILADGQPVFS